MTSKIENIDTNYNGKKVKGKKLTVSSYLDMDISEAWKEVQKSSLLEFVCKGKINFKPIDSGFPKYWEKGMEIKTKMLMYGFIPFGGIHTLKFVDVDHNNFILLTNEKNSLVRIWNHKIEMNLLDENKIKYKDEIELYAGFITGFVALWAESFYKFRQRRWKIVAEKIKTKTQHGV